MIRVVKFDKSDKTFRSLPAIIENYIPTRIRSRVFMQIYIVMKVIKKHGTRLESLNTALLVAEKQRSVF